MAPTFTTERTAPTKKSLRIWVRNNGHVMRKQTKVSYTYPRTVEAAKDPFDCATGKNKMFYMIAINLFPETKIVQPDDSDSDVEMENAVDHSKNEESNSEPEVGKVERKRKRARRSPAVGGGDQCSSASSSSESQGPSPRSSVERSNHTPDKDLDMPITTTPRNKKFSSKSCQRQRLLPLKKTSVKTNNSANLENIIGMRNECSKVVTTDCENCLSVPTEIIAGEANKHHQSSNKPKGNDQSVAKNAAALNNRKLPAIPTIMNSLNKIIESCSASGAVSFSLANKTPRQSRS